jgi:hypothetical protein
VSSLFRAIPERHTDRAPYATDRPLEAATLKDLAGLADDPRVAIAWLTEDPAKARFGELTVAATAAILADAEQARDDYAWYRQDWHEIDRRRDGITMDAGGLDEPARILVRLLPGSSQRAMQDGWLSSTRDRQVSTAAAYGLVMARQPRDIGQLLAAGRLLQRVHLGATVQGLGLQPLNQVMERSDREAATSGAGPFTDGIAELTPRGWRAVTGFRIGHPTRTARPSPRRPAEVVLRGPT